MRLATIEKCFVNYDLHLTKREGSPEKLRKLIMDAGFAVVKKISRDLLHVFAFDDVIILAKRDNSIQTSFVYKLEKEWPYENIWCYWSKNDKNVLVLGHPSATLLLTPDDEGERVSTWYSVLTELIATRKSTAVGSTGEVKVYLDGHSNVKSPYVFVEIGRSSTADDFRALALPLFGINEKRFTKYLLIESIGEVERRVAPYECPLLLHQYYLQEKMEYKFILRFFIEQYQGVDGEITSPIQTPSGFPSVDSSSHSRKQHRKSRSTLKLGNINVFSKSSKSKVPFPAELTRFETAGSTKDSQFFGINYCELVAKILNSASNDDDTLITQKAAAFVPAPLKDLLFIIYRDGPSTLGIFRKSAHSATVQHVQETLNEGNPYDVLSLGVREAASLIKAFFRSLPECIFSTEYYKVLLSVSESPEDEKIATVKSVLNCLPNPCFLLVSILFRVLLAVAKNAESNSMTVENLAICVGPSLLFDPEKIVPDPTELSAVHKIVGTLITHCSIFFGSETIECFDLQLQNQAEAL
ncbi:rho GTPase-activating protein 20-like [Zophobas morio]|uniref:rho GTPase-activating protein 20-like n=1 Tax=Zophobas morio TaxID=2755281 RepID=UPI003083DE4A